MRCVLLLCALLAGCSADVPAEALAEVRAEARFAEFQDAVLRKDARALRTLVCRDARPAIGQLCEATLSRRKPLEVTGVTRYDYEFRVHVRDPKRALPTDAFYVLTKEDGELRVDLLATMGYLVKRGGPRKQTIVPGRLSEAQREQARRMLSKPGR